MAGLKKGNTEVWIFGAVVLCLIVLAFFLTENTDIVDKVFLPL